MVPLGLAERTSARLDWPLHVIDGAAHAPQIEQPDAFVTALADATQEAAQLNTRTR